MTQSQMKFNTSNTAADLPLLMNENTKTILALDFLSSHHAT